MEALAAIAVSVIATDEEERHSPKSHGDSKGGVEEQATPTAAGNNPSGRETRAGKRESMGIGKSPRTVDRGGEESIGDKVNGYKGDVKNESRTGILRNNELGFQLFGTK